MILWSRKQIKSKNNSMESTYDLNSQRFCHGTKTNLKSGDMINTGFNSD